MAIPGPVQPDRVTSFPANPGISMMKHTLLKIHRWMALLFSLPLAVVILTGLVLSFEPPVHSLTRTSGELSAAKVVDLLNRHDPEGKAKAIAYRAYDGTMDIAGVKPGMPMVIDVATGDLRDGPGLLGRTFNLSRKLHLFVLQPLRPVLVLSTLAFLLLAVLGLFMGWPRFSNSLSGWHKAVAWTGLPLLLLAPVTGLLMHLGVTFGGGGSAPMSMGMTGQPMGLAQVIAAAGPDRDLGSMVWVRSMGPRHMMRETQGLRFQGTFLTPGTKVDVPRNWPRAIHEGLWLVPVAFVMNLLISVLSGALVVTGLLLWMKRRNRQRPSGIRMESRSAA